MSSLWQSVKAEILYQVNQLRPFIALAGTQTDGRLTIRRVTEATAGSEQYARLAGADIAVNDEVVCLIVGGKPLVLGKLQRTAPNLRDIGITSMAHKAIYAPPYTTTPLMVGLPAPITFGTLANATDSDAPWIQHTTGTTSGDQSDITVSSLGAGGVRLDWDPDVEFVIKTGFSVLNIRMFIALMTTPPSVLSPTDHVIGFRHSTDNDFTSWRTFTNDNSGSGTSVSTGVAVAANTLYRFRMQLTNGGTIARWWINDVLVRGPTTLSGVSDPPSITTPLYMIVSVQTLTAGPRSIKWSRMSMVHEP